MDNNKITIELKKEEALVLFELLYRVQEKDTILRYEDESEEEVLNKILGILERTLAEPFEKNYLELLEKARSKIKEKY